jgi:2-(1,2-epoxy-1,2-dihydrophenyl)acetyl-CoA isomerase
MYETILYTVENNVAVLRLNRPDKLNAYIGRMNHEIKQAVKAASIDENVRCIVITGEGRAFCSGQDLSEVDENTDYGQVLRDNYGPMMKQIIQCEKPIIAGVNGVAAGAGFSIALACDFRLAHENASFINAFIHVGLIPDAGNLYYLPKLVGQAKALELSVLGEKVTAQQALSLGLVTKVIPGEEFEVEVTNFANRLAQLPTKAIGLIKRYIKMANDLPIEDYLDKEAEGQRIAGLTADHREGISSFLEKRKPQFIGK